MPTARRRHPVTETEDVEAVLDDAARRWPGVPRSRLIRLILLDWARGGCSPQARAGARAELVGSLPGSSTLYRRDDDWPG